jgi:hypothetical protein
LGEVDETALAVIVSVDTTVSVLKDTERVADVFVFKTGVNALSGSLAHGRLAYISTYCSSELVVIFISVSRHPPNPNPGEI